MRISKIYVIWILKKDEKIGIKVIFTKIKTINFPKLMKDSRLQIENVLQPPRRSQKNVRKERSREGEKRKNKFLK